MAHTKLLMRCNGMEPMIQSWNLEQIGQLGVLAGAAAGGVDLAWLLEP